MKSIGNPGKHWKALESSFCRTGLPPPIVAASKPIAAAPSPRTACPAQVEKQANDCEYVYTAMQCDIEEA